jgi:transcriptional regulator with XRE-family HTH domain
VANTNHPENTQAKTFFISWLQGEMASRGWMPTNLATHTGITLAQVTRVLKGEQRPGVKFLTQLAEALDMSQIEVFRLAGVLTDKELEDVQEDDATRKIKRLLAALDPEERERAIHLLEQYVRDHRRIDRKDSAKPRPARGEA